MKTGLFGQQLTLMEELKATTFLAHARLQSEPFFQALTACQLPLESYVGQLRALLVSAVVDELEGSDAAVESLRPWMTDPARFPAEWIAAVESTLARARQQARPPASVSGNAPSEA